MSENLSKGNLSGQNRRGRPRSDKPSAEAIRKREARQAGKTDMLVETAKTTVPPPGERSRLVPVTVLVPKGDEKTIEFTADRLRKIARIEVP